MDNNFFKKIPSLEKMTRWANGWIKMIPKIGKVVEGWRRYPTMIIDP